MFQPDSNAASPASSVSNDDAIDGMEAEEDSVRSRKIPAAEELSQRNMQVEYVEKIIEEVEKKGAHRRR